MHFLKKFFLSSLLALPTLSAVNPAHASCGEASWYGPGLYGNSTASGETLRPGTYTAAHRSLPLGSYVLVQNKDNGRSVKVRINDRGPYSGGRIIDIAHGAAQGLGLVRSGVAYVCITRL